jgi:hypothetical protein
MKQSFDRFILQIPYPLLKKVLYIYVGAVVFWTSAPVVSIILWAIILVDLLIIGYQSITRKSHLLRSHSSNMVDYLETIRAPLWHWGPRLLLIAMAAALTGYLLHGQLGLSGLQIFSLVVGYVMFYRETMLLGAYVAYMVTRHGIGIEFIPGHMVYQTFIPFEEIKSVNVINGKEPSPAWSFVTPLGEEQNGLLLIPSNPNGFTPRERELFITPKNISSFLSHLPPSVRIIHP